jgi:F-type H+-transporting ATPase subunit alpha
MTLEDQIVVLFCAVNHYLLDIAVKDIRRFNDGLIKHIKITHPDIGDSITEKKELTDETSAKLKAGIEEYKKEFIEGKTEPAVLER